jgi:probable DNA repair protein
VLSQIWKSLEGILKDSPRTQDLSQWSEFIGDLLAAVGWPGDAEISDAEQPVIEAWNEGLSDLSALGLVSPPVLYETAVTHLRRLLSNNVEQGAWSSPIQVLDAKDAAGLEFDEAIAVGLSDETWPPPISLSPLVPLALQRIPGIPDARRQRRQLTRALFEAAPKVIAVCSGALAAIVNDFVTKDVAEVAVWQGKLARQAFVRPPLDQVADTQAPPFVSTGDERGGTAIIRSQSLCPFRAFAEFRLQARTPEDASFGFDARERGGFLHKALQNVWQKLESHDRLRLTPTDTLRSHVRSAIAEAVQTSEPGPLHQLSAHAERDRLEELILEWLDHEKERKQSFTVQTVEEDRIFEVPGLRLKLRVDRIDRLRNGNLVLIDYKSGAQTRPKLTGQRPFEPQLLVYAASLPEHVDGIFFGQLRPREVKAVGFSRDRIFTSRATEVKKDWDEYIENGKETVHRLASEFVNGDAAVDPIKGACSFCTAKPICRVSEIGAAEEDEE